MTKASVIRNKFTGGEISQNVHAGRNDVEKFQFGLEHSLNALQFIQGPWTRRPGTKYVASTKFPSKETRLMRFEFSITQAYIIEVGDLYMRFFRNHGQITNATNAITGATNANPVVLTSTGHTILNGDKVVVLDVVGMEELNNREFTAANVTANTLELAGVDGTAYDAYVSGGTVAEIYEIATTYAEADIFDLEFSQSADVVYITHPSYKPAKLSRLGHTSWTLADIDFIDGPYLPTNTSATTMTPSATSGTGKTMTASSAFFLSTDVGRHIRAKHSTTWGWAKIVGYTSSTVVTIDIQSNFGGVGATLDWRVGAWSDTTSYPATTGFYEDRLFYGGALNLPQRLDGSETGQYDTFSPTETNGDIVDSTAISFSMNSPQVNSIIWISDNDRGLLVGTSGAEWVVRPSSLAEALTALNVSSKVSTRNGSAKIPPIQVGRGTVYVQNKKRKLNQFQFFFEVDGFISADLTVFAEHITDSGVAGMAFTQEPLPIIWVNLADGSLVSCMIDEAQEIVGWNRHHICGVFDGGIAQVKSIAQIPDPTETRDELWLLVKRTKGGSTVQEIEYMEKVFEETDAAADAYFMDSGLQYSGASTTELTGLWHLNGETVAIIGDGTLHPSKVVTNGKVTLDRAVTTASVGCGYASSGMTTRWDAGARDGTAQGKTNRINKVLMRLIRSSALQYGPDVNGPLDTYSFEAPLFSGYVELDWDDDYDYEGRVAWKVDTPLPLTIAAIIAQGTTQDR